MSEDLRFDTRLVERMIQSGALSREEYQRYLDSLPDLSSQAIFGDSPEEAPRSEPSASEKRHSKRS